ncbi:hypothetical protein [Halarcobacter sp.]|uniref:hypothetical protein n=1 Tax=Halarcobacter sp. TaxID=2321133 RepID=UPI002AAB22EC|nr:hypothetical protein [Halarcobacter sp.]
MKILITLFLFINLSFASSLKIGDDLSSLKVEDQFDKILEINKNIKKIIIVFSKDKGDEIKSFLETNPNYLKTNNALYFADVSAAPKFVTNLFMVPKFKKYNYSIGLIRDEKVAESFPKKDENNLTIIELEENKISSIKYEKSLK